MKIISQYKSKSIFYNHAVITNPQNANYNFHTHDICELIFLKSGNVSGIIGDKTYKLHKNSLIIFRANIPHRIKIDGNETYERFDVLFDEKILANGIFCKIDKNLDIINLSNNERVLNLFNKFNYYYENFQDDDLNCIITNIIEEIIFNLYLVRNSTLNNLITTTHPAISKAIEFINAHYQEPITIDEICKEIYVTKGHLHHLFTENLKITPKKMINMKRLAKAQELIGMGEKPSSVYSSCGFSDYGTFFRNYTAYFGYSPSEKDKITKKRKIES